MTDSSYAYPNNKNIFSDITDFYKFRYLIINLISRDLTARYQRTFFGILWSFITPLLLMIILTLVFQNVYGRTETRAIYILSGTIIFSMFSQGVNAGLGGLVTNIKIISTINVPKMAFVFSAVISEFINYLLANIVIILIGFFLGINFSISWLLLPVIGLLLLIFTFGISLIISTIAIFFFDIKDIWQIFNRAYYFITPVIFPLELYPKIFQDFQKYNPLYYFLKLFRSSFAGEFPLFSDILLVFGFSLLCLIIGWLIFSKFSKWAIYYL